MTGNILIYGATGYTGKLIAQAAGKFGLQPILAARNMEKLQAVADPLNLPSRGFSLTDPTGLDAALEGVGVVLCIAGPFSATSRPMADACIRRHVHYLDITGEIDVFEALAARDVEAKQAGVMLLPGVGFDVVPTDCLAAHLKRRLPDATDLKLYIKVSNADISRGTAKTAIQEIAGGTRIRRNGQLTRLHQPRSGSCDFGQGPRPTVQISWGDVSTAYHSTGIPNIEVQTEAVTALKVVTNLPGPVKSFLGLGFMQNAMKSLIDHKSEGPSDAARQSGRSILVGVARNARGETVRSRVGTPEAYTLTAMTALDIAKRVASGDFKPGFQTPSLAYGADYILGFDGVTWEDQNT